MVRRWIKKIKLALDPPKPGDVFYGDPFDFIIGSHIEHALHGTRAIYGNMVWQPIPSESCYRLTIESDSMPYYRCTGEVLCEAVSDREKAWKKRSQPRRIKKEIFHDMIVEGRIKKYE